MDLRELAQAAAQVAQNAGRHALQDQVNPHDLSWVMVSPGETKFTVEVNTRLSRYIRTRLSQIEPFNGFWDERPEQCRPGERYWCAGNIDGAINFIRNMAEWTVTITLFEFDQNCHAYPILGVVHAPALGITYLAAQGRGAIRIRRNPIGGEKREKIMPSMTRTLSGSVVSYGMSYVSEESKRALSVVSAIAGKPADIKRVGPASMDLCKVADGTYDAYFEPHLHKWDVPAVAAGAIVVWEAQGRLSQWNGEMIHWRRENDVVASNGLIDDELRPYLI
ncbi:inositol monophosphatase family protein [Bifidobacterium leontopitheci]|nr:inositol monophosphatase family protein [Bifidobacterium leontopitheci]